MREKLVEIPVSVTVYGSGRSAPVTYPVCPTVQAIGIGGAFRSQYCVNVAVERPERREEKMKKNVTVRKTLLEGEVTLHRAFAEVGDALPTNCLCPSCGYEWNEPVRPRRRGCLPGLGSADAAPAFSCPKCKHAWSGKPSEKALPFGAARRLSLISGAPDAGEKPPYRVPLLSETRRLPWNGFTVASTFSGCGGSCLGYKMAGFKVLWASEFVPAAQDSYRANFPDVTLDGRDIREVTAAQILKATGLKKGELDVFDGSPPCQAFSTAGRREKGWGKDKVYEHGARQRNEDLFFEYVRLLKGLQPKVFVAENVSGLVKGKAKGYFKLILAALKACGYRVSVKVLDAQWLGVPQMRQRAIFVGVREDLGLEPAHPDPLPWRYSLREALPWIVRARVCQDDKGEGIWKWDDASETPSPAIAATIGGESFKSSSGRVEAVVGGAVTHDTSGLFSQGDVTDRPCPAITVGSNSMNSGHYRVGRSVTMSVDGAPPRWRSALAEAEVARAVLEGRQASWNADTCLPREASLLVVEPESALRGCVGEEWDRLAEGEQSERYFSLSRPSLEDPSPAVTACGGTSCASVTHPTERRKFTIAELKRVCAFPDDFVLTGSYVQQWARMGNAVPPVMMSHIAATVRDRILAPARAAEKRSRRKKSPAERGAKR